MFTKDRLKATYLLAAGFVWTSLIKIKTENVTFDTAECFITVVSIKTGEVRAKVGRYCDTFYTPSNNVFFLSP